jgi:purine-binding chemotaxis protein CheW
MDEVQLCVLRVGDSLLAVDIMRVQEVTTLQRVSAVPGGSDGVIELRGKVAPVVDLRRRLGLPPLPEARGPRVLVVSAGENLLAMVADRITEVVRLPASSLKALPRSGPGSIIAGAARHQGRVFLLLDVRGLVASSPVRRRTRSGARHRKTVTGR